MANKMLFPMLRDLIVLILIGIIAGAHQIDFFVGDNLHHRGWFRGDRSISNPLNPDTISVAACIVFAFVMPLVVLLITWFAVDRAHRNDWVSNSIEDADEAEVLSSVPLIERPKTDATLALPSNTVKRTVFMWAHHSDGGSTPRSRKLRFFLYQFFVFCFLIASVIIVTTAIKLMVARLRPDFIDRCKPDYTLDPQLLAEPAFIESGWVDGKYRHICTGDEREIIEGRKSFPSAHSSTSLFASTFVALLFFKRCWNRGQRSLMGFLPIPFLMMAVVCAGFIIATSRHWDNRHHPLDIIVGCCIGIVFGFFSLCFDVFTPSWERDGTLQKALKDAGNSSDGFTPSSPSSQSSSGTNFSPEVV